jgi:hypothetical protein
VARDRRRAELILLVLTAITALAAMALLVTRLIAGPGEINEILSAVSSLGIILSLTSGVRAIERYESRQPEATSQNIRMALTAFGAGLLVCIAGLAAGATLNVALTVLFGAAAFGSIQAIRWAGLARWTIGIFVATITVAAAMIVLWRYNSLRMLSPFLIYNRDIARGDFGRAANIVGHRLAGHRRGNLRAAFAHLPGTRQHRYESSVNRRGVRNRTGVADDPLHYRNDNGACRTPLSRCSRPWTGFFFPAAAAACSIIILCQAFCDTSLLNSCVAVISDAVIGLGLAQSVSHREGP